MSIIIRHTLSQSSCQWTHLSQGSRGLAFNGSLRGKALVMVSFVVSIVTVNFFCPPLLDHCLATTHTLRQDITCHQKYIVVSPSHKKHIVEGYIQSAGTYLFTRNTQLSDMNLIHIPGHQMFKTHIYLSNNTCTLSRSLMQTYNSRFYLQSNEDNFHALVVFMQLCNLINRLLHRNPKKRLSHNKQFEKFPCSAHIPTHPEATFTKDTYTHNL